MDTLQQLSQIFTFLEHPTDHRTGIKMSDLPSMRNLKIRAIVKRLGAE